MANPADLGEEDEAPWRTLREKNQLFHINTNGSQCQKGSWELITKVTEELRAMKALR